jgi:TolB-like protein/cytochrome c-type biogenesis protein CcmH/NrfG
MDEPGESGRLQSPGGPGPQRRVFISYASHDVALAQKVCSALEAAEFPCWIAPRNVVPGTMYADGIVHAIDDSSILVLILSEQAVASAHVGREIERAVSKRHPVVALRIDAAPLTAAFEYFLNQSQWIEGGGSDAAIVQLVGAVGQHLSPGTAGSPNNANQPSVVHPKVKTPRRLWVIAAVVVAIALAGGYFLDSVRRSKHATMASTAVISDKSIAVLPFTDMSEKKDQEYFADGMAEEIIDLLVKVPGLKVISRTSSFQFKGKTQDLRSIATELGVAFVLEGSVRKSGDHLRVTVQLINSRDGTQLWSQTYDRDLSDVLKMQDEIALALVRALQIEVGAGWGSRPALRNTEAYTLYLQGLHAVDRFDPQGFEQAVSDFQRAIALDPSSTESEVALGNAYFNLGMYGVMPSAVAFEKARLATERALKLDPNLALAHAQLGDIHRAYDWDWPAADREVKKAMALAPNDGDISFYAAVQSFGMNRCDDALEQINASLAQDPLGAFRYLVLGQIQSCRGRLDEAEEAMRRGVELSPTSAANHYFLGQLLLARGKPEAALTEMLKEPQYNPVRSGGLAMAYFALGRNADSNAALAQMLSNAADRYPFQIAQVYAFRGEADEAFKWLERAYAHKDGGGLPIIKSDPVFKKFESDPRYKAFLKKMNLAE